ncbi:PLP-dependent transferase, partial [Rickenella mellea]
MPTLDVEKARSQFPSLKNGYIFADNAGGSQCLKDVVDRVSDYLLNTNVQLGADYSVSVESTQRVNDGMKDTAVLINASSPNEIVFGSSSTSLVENLVRAIDSDIFDDEEIIITGEHEANVGAWTKLAKRRGLACKTWAHTVLPETPNNPYAVQLAISSLTPLISAKTRLVAFTACSNILGSVVDVEAVIRRIREVAKEKGARRVEICIDCVAYAPHRRINVKKWDVDYCFFSYYKVYGTHTAVMFVRSECLNRLTSLAHHFLKVDSSPYKLQPGGPGYELIYGTTGVLPYLKSLAPSDDIDEAFNLIAEHEQNLIAPLLDFLTSAKARERGVLIVGSEHGGPTRVPTVSFVVVGKNLVKSRDVVAVFDKKGGMGIRYGHFYAYTLVASL